MSNRFSIQCARIGEGEHVAPWYTVATSATSGAADTLARRYERIGEHVRVWDNVANRATTELERLGIA
jgi:hypothetical protein